MDYLIIYAHPNSMSFNCAVSTVIQKQLQIHNKSYFLRDLYQSHFNPVLSANDFSEFANNKVPEDIQKEQDFIQEASRIIFIYPIWWFGMPALLKGYIDRVFSKGFAYDFDEGTIKGLLTNKEIMIFNTTGGSRENYQALGLYDALKRTTETGIFEFCGMRIVHHEYFYEVPLISDEARKSMLESLKAIVF